MLACERPTRDHSSSCTARGPGSISLSRPMTAALPARLPLAHLLSSLAAGVLPLPLGACSGGEVGTSDAARASYVTSAACADCHAEESAAWRGSQHDLAMQEATEATVLGDFDDVAFEHLGALTRFFRRDGEFWVEAQGRDGEQAEFRVRYTFGIEPLQQYLLELDRGWLQALTVAWDTEDERWFSLYPDDRLPPEDPLHWTGRYQNWNGFCADCHSTGLVKGYDLERDAFATTFAEIDVACEACHGPGSEHVAWAQGYDGADAPPDGSKGLVARLARGERELQTNACAPCHSRRSPTTFDAQPGDPFLENYRIDLLGVDTYHPDGQILGEVYEFGSFAQSAMHARGVACTDCHDPHSLELLTPGNSLCAQCHSPFAPLERFPTLTPKVYDAPEHHFHPEGSAGALCVNCHMPERTYMVVDPRRDHSFRIPRPDLAVALGTPDACSGCHAGPDEGAAWAAARIEEWYGGERKAHFASAFVRADRGDPSAFPDLARLASDAEAAPIVRASALDRLARFGPPAIEPARPLLADPDPLVRSSAVRVFQAAEPLARIGDLVKLLEDPSRSVRSEAARMLAPARADILQALAPEAFPAALAEWEEAQLVSAEMPWAHLNLGALRQDRGDTNAAVLEYEKAIELDPYFLPAYFNLATLHNAAGRNLAAERALRAGLEHAPDEGELHYSLGLLLAEMNRLPDAAASLLRAAELLPDRPRIHYNAGLALEKAGRASEAERELLEAHRLDPRAPEVVHALALMYERQQSPELALPYAAKLLQLAPDSEPAQELLQRLRQAVDGI